MLRTLTTTLLACALATGCANQCGPDQGRGGPPSGDTRPQRGGPGGPGGMAGGPGGMNRPQDTLALQLDLLHEALRLDRRQEPYWLAYTDRLQALMSDMQRPHAESAQADALHRIDDRIAPLRNRLAALDQLSDAAARLYRELDARQRGVADEMLPATVPLLADSIEQGGPHGGMDGNGQAGQQGQHRRR
ncbi:hypothetical protein GCM10025771_09490 [Niveibacterium umoris]|uniref:LTXXQ motif family protein n=1 Tax=Niveibacterium umoris TaxID=1193620 RepID=A0A840BPA2_9RHOO|nr:hypothetical protein [Niveibacterium umoris]MBB4013502.1 hypothetical protein [Niveibacterium umoris]